MRPTVVLLYWSFVRLRFSCVYFVNLRRAEEYVIVLGNLRRLCACLWDYVLIQLFITLLIVFCFSILGLLIQLFWLFYFALYFGWLTVPHKTPSPGARRPKGPRVDIVPVLGTSPGIATLLGKRPEGFVPLPTVASFLEPARPLWNYKRNPHFVTISIHMCEGKKSHSIRFYRWLLCFRHGVWYLIFL